MSQIQSQNDCSNCGAKGHAENQCATHPQTITWKGGGKDVFVKGDWSKWQIMHKMRPINQNPNWFIFELALQPGTYKYKFYIDGHWKIDCNEPVCQNEFNSFNNVLQVVPYIFEPEQESDFMSDSQIETEFGGGGQKKQNGQGIKVKISTNLSGKNISVKGSWDNWRLEIPLQKAFHHFVAYLYLPPGIYQYKFIVDGVWEYDKYKQKVKSDSCDSYNNIIKISDKMEINNIQKQQTEFNINALQWAQIELKDFQINSIQGHSMTMLGDYIFIFGGFGKGKFHNQIYCLNSDFEQVYLDTVGQAPEPRTEHIAIEYGSKILFYGGYNQRQVFSDYFVFDSSNNNWTKAVCTGELPSKRERCSLTKINQDTLVLFGGYMCSPDMMVEQNYNEVFSLNLITMNWSLTKIKGDPPKPRSSHTACIYHQSLYIFGGVFRTQSSPTEVYDDVWKLNFESNSDLKWEKLTNIKGKSPKGRFGHTANIVNKQYMVVFGGRSIDGDLLNDVQIFNLKQYQWIEVEIQGVPPFPRYLHSSVVSKTGAIYIFGGQKPKNAIFQREDELSQIGKSFSQNLQIIQEQQENDQNSQIQFKQQNQKHQ